VHDAALVDRPQPVRRLRDQPHRRDGVEAPGAGQHLRQRLAVDELHHQEGDPAAAPVIVDRRDRGMVDAGHGFRLDEEPLGEVRLPGHPGQHGLDGDDPAEHLVDGPPHLTHATGTDPRVEPVAVAEPETGVQHDPSPSSVGPLPTAARRASCHAATDGH
jgi:hypothetical protein